MQIAPIYSLRFMENEQDYNCLAPEITWDPDGKRYVIEENKKMTYARYVVIAIWLACACLGRAETTILVEAECFAELGGWVIDQQAMDVMGSPYLMAHGLGFSESPPVVGKGEVFTIKDHTAFLILPKKAKGGNLIPWVWYAPTLKDLLPGKEDK